MEQTPCPISPLQTHTYDLFPCSLPRLSSATHARIFMHHAQPSLQMAERRERVAKWQAERRGLQPNGTVGESDAGSSDGGGGAVATAAVVGNERIKNTLDDDGDADDEAGPGEAQDLGDSQLTLADEDGLMAQEGLLFVLCTALESVCACRFGHVLPRIRSQSHCCNNRYTLQPNAADRRWMSLTSWSQTSRPSLSLQVARFQPRRHNHPRALPWTLISVRHRSKQKPRESLARLRLLTRMTKTMTTSIRLMRSWLG